jgi:hypothetical protein
MPRRMTKEEAIEAGLWHEPTERLALMNCRKRIRDAYDAFISQQNLGIRIVDGSMVADSWSFQQQLRDLNPLFEELEQAEESNLLWERANPRYWDGREGVERGPEEWPMCKWIDWDPKSAKELTEEEISFVEKRLGAYVTMQEPLQELLRLRHIAKEDTHDLEEQLKSIEARKEALEELLPLLRTAKDRLEQIEQTGDTTKTENASISIEDAQKMAVAAVKRYREAQSEVEFYQEVFAESFDGFLEDFSCCEEIGLPSPSLNAARVLERPILRWRILALAELLNDLGQREMIEKMLSGEEDDDSDGEETVTGLNGEDHESSPDVSRDASVKETPDNATEAHDIITERLEWIERKLKSIPENQKALEELLDYFKAAKEETSTVDGSVESKEAVEAEETKDVRDNFCACGSAGWEDNSGDMTVGQAVILGGVENAKAAEAYIEEELQEIEERLLTVKGRRDELFHALGFLAAEGGVGEWEKLGFYDVHGEYVQGRFVDGKWVAWSEPKEVPSARVKMTTSSDRELVVNIVPGEEPINPTQVAREHVEKHLKQMEVVRKQTADKLKRVEIEEKAMKDFLEWLQSEETSGDETEDAIEIDENVELKEQLLEAEAEEVVLEKVLDGLEAANTDGSEGIEETKHALEQHLDYFKALKDQTLKQLVENAEAKDKVDGGKATYDVEQTIKEIENLTEGLTEELTEAAKEEIEKLTEIKKPEKVEESDNDEDFKDAKENTGARDTKEAETASERVVDNVTVS